MYRTAKLAAKQEQKQALIVYRKKLNNKNNNELDVTPLMFSYLHWGVLCLPPQLGASSTGDWPKSEQAAITVESESY